MFLRRPDWPRIQDGSLACCWKLSQGCWLEPLDSSPQPFHAAWASHRIPKGISTQHYLYHILIAKTHQNQLRSRGRGKDSSTTLQILHVYGGGKKGFIIGPVINPTAVDKETSLVDSIPTGSREADLLLLDLLQNRVRISHITWSLTSRGPRAPWGCWKDQGLCRLENSYGL